MSTAAVKIKNHNDLQISELLAADPVSVRLFPGEFEKYAVRWQSSPSCLVAGFLGVLSSELSVFTLVVITAERFYAISNAMQLNKRVRLTHAGT